MLTRVRHTPVFCIHYLRVRAYRLGFQGKRRCLPEPVAYPSLKARVRRAAAAVNADTTGWTSSFKASFLRKPTEVAEVRSYTFLAFALAAAAGSLFLFNVLADQITLVSRAQGFSGPDSTLQILDVRSGYTSSEVFATLQSWGKTGRRLYLAIEAIDITIYATAYRGAFMVIFNRVTEALVERWPQSRPSIPLALIPVFLASLDYLEDALQVSLVLSFSDGWSSSTDTLPAWATLVQAASCVNIAKWTAVKLGVGTLLAGIGAVLLYEAAHIWSRDSR